MRISGVLIPPGYLRWAAMGAGVVLLGVIIAVLVSMLGLLGGATEDTGTAVTATVTTGAPCNQASATETVTFKLDGRDRQARFDGCGHAKGESVEIAVPAGATGDDLVVQAAAAAVGDGGPRGLELLLIVVSGIAGAGFAVIVRRGPKTNPLPPALRLRGAV